MTNLAAWLGDRVNPIVVKEARQAVNSRLVGGTLLLFLGVQLLVMMLTIGYRDAGRQPGDIDMRAGRDVFLFVQTVLLGTCMVLIPALTGGRLAAERSDVNVDLLFVTSLTPRAIMAGKLATAAATALLIFSACAPFMTFAYVLRGLDFPTIAFVLAVDFLAVVYSTMAALLVAAIPANRGMRVVLGLGLFAFLAGVFLTVYRMTAEFLRFNDFDTASGRFWLGFLGVALAAAGAIGLAFVWAVALITPPAANRALPVRLYVLALWLLAAGGCAGWSLYVEHPGPVLTWGIASTAVFVVQMLIAVSERDELGPRVRRRIPHSQLLRGPAWYLFSGAAGGVAFALFGGLLSAAGMLAWRGLTSDANMGWRDRWWEPAAVAGLMTGYAYCYGLTAVLFRRLARNTALRPSTTWVQALILFGLGCMGPFLLRITFAPRRYGYGHDDLAWLYLTNPVVTIDNVLSYRSEAPALALTFLAAWGVAVTLLNLRWLTRQVVTFRPPAAPA